MKKRLSVFTFFAISLLVLSCENKINEPAGSETNLVSGIYSGETHSINDTISAHVMFSFDENSDGSVKGGVWIRILNFRKAFSKGKFRSKHVTEKFTHLANGDVEIEGTVDFGDDFGNTKFSGVLSGDNFNYILKNDHLDVYGVASWQNNFLKEGSTLYKGEGTDYTGFYTISNPDSSIKLGMKIEAQAISDDFGTLELYGSIEGTMLLDSDNNVYDRITAEINDFEVQSYMCDLSFISVDLLQEFSISAYAFFDPNPTWNPGKSYSLGIHLQGFCTTNYQNYHKWGDLSSEPTLTLSAKF